ncbi:hypothetical protein N307_00754, partial [Dryobates pubescens]
GPIFVKVPFSPSDLVIWKQSAGAYRENPKKTARVFKMIVKTQNPDWDDTQVILDTLMDPTEKDMVLRKGRERAEEDIRTAVMAGNINVLFALANPGWDPNDNNNMVSLRVYQGWVTYGVLHGIPKVQNWARVYDIREEPKNLPSAFL